MSKKSIAEAVNIAKNIRKMGSDSVYASKNGAMQLAQALLELVSEDITKVDYEEVLTDHRRLVRELDVALNGEEGAAKQASLCDIVAQVKHGGWKLVRVDQ